jgi:chromate reductase, NAD(P)H dehydrogenase (quinone)
MSGNGRRVLALSGSLRKASFNAALLRAAGEAAPSGTLVTLFDGLEGVPLFNEDLEIGAPPPAVKRLRDEVESADGLLISTPEYNHSLPGVLKNAIDWLSRPPVRVLAGKPVAVIGATTGTWGTRLAQAALRQVLFSTESLVMQRSALFVRGATGLFDPRGKLIDSATAAALGALMQEFTDWINLVGSTPAVIPAPATGPASYPA